MKLLTVLFLLVASNAFGQQTAPVVRTDTIVMSDGFNTRGSTVVLSCDTIYYVAYFSVDKRKWRQVFINGFTVRGGIIWIQTRDDYSITRLRWRGRRLEIHHPQSLPHELIIAVIENPNFGIRAAEFAKKVFPERDTFDVPVHWEGRKHR